MQYSPQQGEALKKVAAWYSGGIETPQTFYLAGYAGTGKTTIAKGLANECDAEFSFMAFTGKAASVLTKKGCPATTIHSAIYKIVEPDKGLLKSLREQIKEKPTDTLLKEKFREAAAPKFTLNDESLVYDLDLIIVDEVSMVNEQLALDLLSFGKKILVLGDPGQLPPVGGEGYFTKGEPDFMLTEIHRQAADSPIIRMATLVRQGHRLAPGKYGEGCTVLPRDSATVYDSFDQVIVGLNRTRSSLNALMRKGGPTIPEAADKLICLRNDAEKGLMNGTQWFPTAVADKGFYVDLDIRPWDDILAEPKPISCHPFDTDLRAMMPYERRRFNEFDYGYAITCHKAQGSQWENVFIKNESFAFRQDAAKWLYTALTRAEKFVTVG